MDKKVFLVADSDAKLVEEIQEILKSTYDGATVYSAIDGKDALVKLKNVPPVMLITELELPKFSGSELIRTVLASSEHSNISILVLTDIPDQDVFVEEVVKGRIQFLAKPFSKQGFLDSVNRGLNRTSNQKDPEFRLRLISPGDILFAEGEKAESAFLLKKGKLRAFTKKSGEPKTLGEIFPGEFVGEMAHINGEPRSAYVEAIENSELIEIPLGTLDTLLFSKPAWSKALMKTLSRRLKAANMPKK